MNIQGKTILITGASGVIGSHFLKELQSHDASVYAVHSRPLQKHLRDLKGITFIQCDLTESKSLEHIPKADIIIHGATFSSPISFMTNPINTLKLNTLTTFELLNKLNEDGKFLYISSSEIYSGSHKIPYKELQTGETNTDHPRACYIEGKRCGEVICINSGKDIKIVRIGTTYGTGARVNDGRVLYDFITQALTQHKVIANGGINDFRSFCYVTDAIEMIWNVLLKGEQVIYNIGGGDVVSIGDLAKKIASITNSSIELIDDKRTPYVLSYMDMDRYNNEFGKHHDIGLDEGLLHVIEWYKNL
jgi:UDP-glucuronate decarboxylase